MLESLAAWVLKYFLGRYVENLNTDQLTIGLLQGEVELDNLPLKKEALRQVGLPIQVSAGFIGKVKLQIPITQIRSAPWVILIEQVYIVAAPVNLQEWDEDAEEQALLEQKLSVLDAIEAQWRSSTEGLDQGYYASSYTSWMNFGTSVVTNIVENLQGIGPVISKRLPKFHVDPTFRLNISDVHIRYEDNITFDHNFFTFGIVIDSLVAQSCNENWERGYSSGENSYKQLQLSNLSVYWEDCGSSDILEKKDAKDFIEAMGKSEFRGSQFLVEAVSGKVNMRKNRCADPLRSKSIPRIVCDILFDEFPVTLTSRQYSQMVISLKSLEVLKRRIALRHIRPSASALDEPRKWWHYAYLAVVESKTVQFASWDYALKRARDNLAYVQYYEKVLLNPAGVLTEEDTLLKDRVELEQTLEELRALRIAAMLRVRPVTKAASPAASGSYLSAWFPQFWYSTAASGDNVDEKKLNDELIEALENPMDDALYLKRDVVFGQFNFCLKQGTVVLCTVSPTAPSVIQSVFELQLEKLLVGLEWRPRNTSFKLSLSLGAVFLKDRLTPDTIFPILVSPQSRELSNIDSKKNLPPGIARLLNRGSSPRPVDESLLDIIFETKPFDSNVDCRVNVKTQSVDLVYNPAAFTWLAEFFTKPAQLPGSSLQSAARRRYQAFKTATKNELIKNWEDILAGKLANRKTWHVDLDISAPHIIFVENFYDRNAVIVVVDLGKLHFTNYFPQKASIAKKDSDDEDAFETPCSTPPGSEASPEDITIAELSPNQINEMGLRSMLYERYDVELADMQVLVGRVKDSWKYAQLKGTSTLHVLDRFNIKMQVERRLVYTVDPQYPSLTFNGRLPRLIVHVNEQKVSAIRAVYATVLVAGNSPSPTAQELLPMPFETQHAHAYSDPQPSEDATSLASRLIIMQFTIQHLALEVQSRNRSVAELQVSGVRACLTQRQYDFSLTLSVHSLLLVDAMQTFGRDFELLLASHKHVGMDSLSGSLRDSEPCSPTSPASPEPGLHPASPIAISQALNDLQDIENRKFMSPSSPVFINSPPNAIRPPSPETTDAEALIIIEFNFIDANCPGCDGQAQQIAAVQFNNLDVIANQETIVELIGFVRRVFPPSKTSPAVPLKPNVQDAEPTSPSSDENTMHQPLPTKTEATFDFQRLNVLLLRAGLRNGVVIGKKICTATIMQAKIKVTAADDLTVEGSLGGVQMLDLTTEGMRHPRILSLGADPLAPTDNFSVLSEGLYRPASSALEPCEPAFSFSVRRPLKLADEQVDVKIRLASVWYTHSPMLLRELQSCATEFKQYLANLARSIRSAATEVALGLVHARAEALAHSLSVTSRFPSSLYGGSNPDVSSPRKRRRSFSQSLENVLSTPQTPFTARLPHTPWSPDEVEMLDSIILNLDIVLDSPVIVLPKAADSDQVFVAHLGKMTLKNSSKEREDVWQSRVDAYHFHLENMNVFSVEAAPVVTELSFSANGDAILPKPEQVYCCQQGRPILHDTVIDLTLERCVDTTASIRGSWDLHLDDNYPAQYRLSGGLVGPLKLSLSRTQYQQIIATSNYAISNLGALPPDLEIMNASKRLGNISEEESSSDTPFSMDIPKAAPPPLASQGQTHPRSTTSFTIVFEVPEFTVALMGGLCGPVEHAIVSISFRDFFLNFDRAAASSHLKMSLKSLVMENLLVSKDNKSRFLVISSAEPTAFNRRLALSQSCPAIPQCPVLVADHSSLPDNLSVFSTKKTNPERSHKSSNPFGIQAAAKELPCTPPPSPRPAQQQSEPMMSREENLVLITIDCDEKPDAEIYRSVMVDFNCLDIVAKLESWVVVIDFFAVESTQKQEEVSRVETNGTGLDEVSIHRTSKLDVEIKGLTLVMIRPQYEVCKVSINDLSFGSVSSSEFSVDGRLGSLTVSDLSPQGKLYRERFLTTGSEALNVRYIRHSNENRSCDSELSIKMSSIVYVHTQRFLNEIFSYFNRFSQLQTVMASMRSANGDENMLKPSSRMLLSISAGSPVLILPVASNSVELVVAELGELSVSNGFRRAGSLGTIATSAPEGTVTVRCLLDSMSIELVNMDVYTGWRDLGNSHDDRCMLFGELRILRNGAPLLPDKCRLKLQVDRNLDKHLSREVPDITILGTLSKLEAFLDLSQYKVIRGLLTYNIGENMQDLVYSTAEVPAAESASNETVWRTMSINLDLVNVVLHLRERHGEGANLACVNFIRSRLVVDIFSDSSQDIDLVSAEILLTDTRYLDEPANKRYNVFTNILQPMGPKQSSRASSSHRLEKKPSQDSDEGVVQAEVHHRRRKGYSKTTILLHNMRVMAILDWWEMVRDFIVQNATEPAGFGAGLRDAQAVAQPRAAHATAYVLGLGVADKFPPTVDVEAVPFELKLNVTDSEIVLVEDTAAWDTNAIILKSTTVISFRPGLLEKPLSCNLNHCEVFSCMLGMEDDTALSIIDPVTINMEVALRGAGGSARGISDAVLSPQDRSLEVSMTALNIRLSYHDFRMLSNMLESVPKQTRRARDSVSQREKKPANFQNQITKLAALGFDAADCSNALERCNGQLDDAALWLTQNASHSHAASNDASSSISFHAVEVKIGCLSIVVIDDCRDADVPLLEMTLSQLAVKQILGGEGIAKFAIFTEYYNRVLSGWEPFIESWRCKLKWDQSLTSGLSRNRLKIDVGSDDLVNGNITSTLLELFTTVKNNWTEDYSDASPMRSEKGGSLSVRRRSPFVPFALKNETGCQLWFTTFIKTSNSVADRDISDEEWIPVEPDETIPFTFESREKSRHRDTHKVRVHQIAVKAGIWGPVTPVSVDKVGTVFRHGSPLTHLMPMEVPPARLVFVIALEGSARKLVTVRSALTIRNNLTEAVEAKLENTVTYPGVWDDTMCAQIQPDTTLSVPLSHAHAHVWIRPVDSVNLQRYHAFSSSPLGWMSVVESRESVFETHQCHSNRDNSFRFVAGIYHEALESGRGLWMQPAHSITLYSPVVITNLLPCDLHFSLRQNAARGHIKPGLSANIHEVDSDQKIEINLHLDGFARHGTVTIPVPAAAFRSQVRVEDESQRRLILNVAVDILEGAGVRISVSAPFWIINKTSLPLVVRQEGSAQEAAGQGPEVEVARVVSPLLFSLADSDGGPMAQVRVGLSHLAEAQPQWCQPFPLLVGTGVLRLRIMKRDRPDVVYILGMNIRAGKGRHRRTKIVTLSPRFQLHNKSSFQLQFAQHCLATTLNDPSASITYCKAVQECSLAWHWPRLDRELLLCIRLVDIKDCLWSGGFAIDNDDSFHVNIRDVNGKMHFLRAEIVLQGATYFAVITDADSMPPPVRVDNGSHVAVEFYQADQKVETARTTVRPHASMAYAWDLPHGGTKLAVVAPGGGCATYEVNNTSYKSNVTLTYENFIYIAFTATFNNADESGGSCEYEPLDVASQQLVLDCVDGRRVFLNRKLQGQRSQLWCMTSDGQLQHEGSSPPRDPKSKSSRSSRNTMVLDIAGTAPQPSQCVPLVLRRPDPRRSSTQTWRFTQDGRLCCAHSTMCVQAKDGFFGLRQGSEVVLGPRNGDARGQGLPIEEAISRMKMRLGSGCLVVSVVSDGPTRVLRIVDPMDSKVPSPEWMLSVQQEEAYANRKELEVDVRLSSGLGISVVSRDPLEELLYIHLSGIIVNMGRTPSQTTFDCSIQDVQCDNQLFEPACPVALYVTKSYRDDEPKRHLPAILISSHKQHSFNANAHIFKHLIVTVKSLSLTIEELLLLKLCAVFSIPGSDSTNEDTDESDFETQRRVLEATSVHAARYYFGIIKLTPDLIRLTVATSPKLPAALQIIKKKLGLRLIKFEDATVELKEFKRRHPFETSQCLWGSAVKHLKTELAWQAAAILGTVDFLGNPLGLINDVSEGVVGLFSEGNVGTLVKSVTHGLSNSAAKVTGSLSDGLGKVILDESHEETRQRIRTSHSGSSSDHLWAGLKGFGFGLLGGMTSLVKQTYEGAAQEGLQGLVSGIGKGLVGTVTKPMVGMLDFASETASAVRDSSRTSDRPPRIRLPRVVLGPGGLLPPFSQTQSLGQDFLYTVNDRNYWERLVWYEVLVSDDGDLRLLISNDRVLLFTSMAIPVAQYHLSSLAHAQPLTIDEPPGPGQLHYIELVLHLSAGSGISTQEPPKKRPRVRCDGRDIAERVCQQINYARALFDELKYTLPSYGELCS